MLRCSKGWLFGVLEASASENRCARRARRSKSESVTLGIQQVRFDAFENIIVSLLVSLSGKIYFNTHCQSHIANTGCVALFRKFRAAGRDVRDFSCSFRSLSSILLGRFLARACVLPRLRYFTVA